MRLPSLLAPVLSLGLTVLAHAQGLPQPSRTVYKCVVNGTATYSDAPCLGAQRIDVEPTRGLNKSSGKEVVGNDVRRERFNEQFAEMIRPVTGMPASQFEVERRRVYLAPEAKAECKRLDVELARQEGQERQTAGEQKAAVQARLLEGRKRQRELGC